MALRLNEQLDQVLIDCDDLPVGDLQSELLGVRNAIRQLPQALELLSKLKDLPQSLGTALRRCPYTLPQIESLVARQTWEEYRASQPAVERYDTRARDWSVGRLAESFGPWLTANATEIRRRVRTRFRESLKLIGIPARDLTPSEQALRQTYSRGRRGLEHEFGKTMRFKAIRELIEGETGPMIRDLKPVWLMSPLSVSDTLPLDPGFVDVVIFDEASQIPLEEAVPTLFRGRQVIVVGDEKQLPPTSFFSTRLPNEHEDDSGEESEVADDGNEPQAAEVDLADDSFLRFAARNLPSTMLEWHYRSRSESLIAFSNQSFYGGRLLTVPDVHPLAMASGKSGPGATAASGVELLLQRPVSFHFLENGVYEKRCNRPEADAIAGLVAGLLERSPELTVGVIAFSEAQQSEIESALERLAEQQPEFRRRLEAEREREIDGQFVGLLVKNLENIQGDERDVVIASICYGPNPLGKIYMNFGPINRDGESVG